MKKITLIIILIALSFASYSQDRIRKGAYFIQDGDTVSILYSNGQWTLESDTTFVMNLDSLYVNGVKITGSGGGGGLMDSVYVSDQGIWTQDTIPKSDSVHVVSFADTTKTQYISPINGGTSRLGVASKLQRLPR